MAATFDAVALGVSFPTARGAPGSMAIANFSPKPQVRLAVVPAMSVAPKGKANRLRRPLPASAVPASTVHLEQALGSEETTYRLPFQQERSWPTRTRCVESTPLDPDARSSVKMDPAQWWSVPGQRETFHERDPVFNQSVVDRIGQASALTKSFRVVPISRPDVVQ